ncbi:MAG: hypothetical protein JW751_03215 [Polyangiaceae bacterium]|nr:hypothetical protein [Polyangiaceae bacterium]
MCSAGRHSLIILTVAGAAMLARPALAWVETSVQSDSVYVDVTRQGTATIRHEMVVRVRGGPLRGIELAGVDGDADPLPDSTVVETVAGRSAASLPVILQRRDDGTLALEIDSEKGVRRGTYLFRFAYRTDLRGRDLIHVRNGRAEVRWIGPRYEQGVETAKVVFLLPPAPEAPELPPVEGSTAADPAGDLGGVFLGTLRRGAEKDEFEVVRPYVAKGEPVVWRVVADARAFGGVGPSAGPTPPPTPPVLPGVTEQWRAVALGGAGAVALLYALLVVAKWRALAKACAKRRAVPRALLPLPAALRGAVAGLLLVAAAAVAVVTEFATFAGILLVASMLIASTAPSRLLAPLRGPGEWRPLNPEDDLWQQRERTRLPGRWLDAGTLPGFALFVLSVGVLAVAAWSMVASSPYYALLVALSTASLVPIFCTGRPSELPRDPVASAQRPLRRLHRRLARTRGLDLELLGRFPRGGTEPDELRLKVGPEFPLPGFSGIEVALEVEVGTGGAMSLPVVLVRALEGSPAHDQLARTARWSRGRTAEERVAILRPKLPTVVMTAALVSRLATIFTDGRRRHLAAAPTAPPKRPAPRAVSPRRHQEPKRGFRAPSPRITPDTPPPHGRGP